MLTDVWLAQMDSFVEITASGGVGDISGPSWFEIAHVENENFDYTSPTRKFLADKWWGDGGSTG